VCQSCDYTEPSAKAHLSCLQALFGSASSQHSFELKDCAKNLHKHLIKLGQQHSIPPATSLAAANALVSGPSRSDAGKPEADGADDAAAARKAQAKARQVTAFHRYAWLQHSLNAHGSTAVPVGFAAARTIYQPAFLQLVEV